MPHSSALPLAYLFLRTLWIFQALAAIPILVLLGLGAVTQFFDTFETVYNLIRSLLVALMASAIIFIVLIQHSLSTEYTSRHLTMISEMAKSALATGMWLWLMLDSVLNNTNNYRFFDRSVRMQASGFVAVVLLSVSTVGFVKMLS